MKFTEISKKKKRKGRILVKEGKGSKQNIFNTDL